MTHTVEIECEYAGQIEELESEKHELEDEITQLSDKLSASEESAPKELCSHCRQPQRDWPALLDHYDSCEVIRRARRLLT